MAGELHTHSFNGVTSYDNGHTHYFNGITSANPDVQGHIHYMNGLTSYNDMHVHDYQISTGPEIETQSGHYHYYRGYTRYADGHLHFMEGYTSMYR